MKVERIRLKRLCSRCGEIFLPVTRFNKICDKCNMSSNWREVYRNLNKKVKKKHEKLF